MTSRPTMRLPAAAILGTASLLFATLAGCSGASVPAAATARATTAGAVASPDASAPAPSIAVAASLQSPSSTIAPVASTAAAPLPSTGVTGDLSTIDSLSRALDGALSDDQASASQGDTNP